MKLILLVLSLLSGGGCNGILYSSFFGVCPFDEALVSWFGTEFYFANEDLDTEDFALDTFDLADDLGFVTPSGFKGSTAIIESF